MTRQFPKLASPPFVKGTIVDGELVVLDEEGKPDFSAVMKRLQTKNADKIRRLSKTNPAQFVVFDILYHKGHDVTHLPLMQRESLLETVVKDTESIVKMRFVDGQGTTLFEFVRPPVDSPSATHIS